MSDDGTEHVAPTPRGHDGSHYQPKPGVAIALLVLFVLVVVGVLHYVSPVSVGGGAANSTTTTTTGSANSTTTTLPRSQVKVQVANGTTLPGLARTYTDLLTTQGWDVLGPLNGPKVATTIVYYRYGFGWAARQIASEIKAKQSSLHALTNSTGVAGATNDDVVVVVGPDLAHG